MTIVSSNAEPGHQSSSAAAFASPGLQCLDVLRYVVALKLGTPMTEFKSVLNALKSTRRISYSEWQVRNPTEPAKTRKSLPAILGDLYLERPKLDEAAAPRSGSPLLTAAWSRAHRGPWFPCARPTAVAACAWCRDCRPASFGPAHTLYGEHAQIVVHLHASLLSAPSTLSQGDHEPSG